MKTIITRRSERKIAYMHNIVYDELSSLTLQLLIPYYADNRQERFPCVVFVQGSGWGEQNVYANIASLTKLAEKGYVIAVVQYRASKTAAFPAQIIDTKTAIRFLRKNCAAYSIDSDLIVISGDSSGAHTAVMVAVTEGDPSFSPPLYNGFADSVKGCIDLYGPTAIWEMNDYPSSLDHCGPESPEGMLLGGVCVLDHLALARRTDPLTYLDSNKTIPPMLIFHGDKDSTVPFHQSVRLYEALREKNVPVSFYKMLGAEHGGPAFWTDEVIDIEDRFLRSVLYTDLKGDR